MFVFIDLILWRYEFFSDDKKAEEIDMSLLKSISSNFAKISYVISHISSSKKHEVKLGLLSQICPSLFVDKTNCNILLQPLLRLNHYEIFGAGKKLVFEKNFLLNQDFKFEKVNNLSDLKLLLITLDHISLSKTKFDKNSLSLKLEDYFDIVGIKDNTYFLAGYNDEEKFLNFCSKLVQGDLCNIFVNKYISSITNLDLVDAHASDSHIEDKLNTMECNQGSSLLNKLQHEMSLNISGIFTNLNIKGKVNGINSHTLRNNSVNSGKPPNVLVYTGSNADNDKKYDNVSSILHQCLARDKYVVYQLRQNQVTTVPWIDNTTLLVLASSIIPQNELSESFLTYFLRGGTVLSLSSNFDEHFFKVSKPPNRQSEIIKISYKDLNNVNVYGSPTCYDADNFMTDSGISFENIASNCENGGQVIVLARHKASSGTALLSLVSFEMDTLENALTADQFVTLKLSNPSRINVFRDILSTIGLNCSQSKPPPLSPLILYGSSQKSIDEFLLAIKEDMDNGSYHGRNASYELLNSKLFENTSIQISKTHLPVITDGVINGIQCEFDFETYKQNLKTSTLGNVALFGSVVTTTMNIIDDYMNKMPKDVGLVAIASSQTSGIGRGSNVWLSPKGCALFSLHVKISLESPLGNYISCFQQLVALASVLAIRRKKGYEKFDLRIKWPNDVYYGNRLKLGGVLIKSSVIGSMVHINLGCGINISNKDPTACLNDIIAQHNNSCSKTEEHLQLFSVEEFVARLITQIELLVNEFQEDIGDSFYDLYHQYWLHSNQEISLYAADGPKGTILGITQEGYLLVRLEDGHIVEVHPDGNSFDMMKNLIISKIQR